MKTNLLKIATMLLVVVESFSCGEKSEADQLATLEDTKWKLVGIVDIKTGILTELEPIDCEECYTLAFDTDSTFITFSPANNLGGGYIADYETYNIQVTYFGGTKVGEIGDGKLYTDPFWKRLIHSFSILENELRLYYDDNKNFLLLKLK